MPNRIIQKSMLQIDYDQRCPSRVEFGEAMLVAAARNDALHDEIGDRGAVQLHRDAPSPHAGSDIIYNELAIDIELAPNSVTRLVRGEDSRSGRCRRVWMEQLGSAQVRPQFRRDRITQKLRIALELFDIARAGEDRRNGGMGERELHCRRDNGYAVAVANGPDRVNPVDDVRRGGLVIP